MRKFRLNSSSIAENSGRCLILHSLIFGLNHCSYESSVRSNGEKIGDNGLDSDGLIFCCSRIHLVVGAHVDDHVLTTVVVFVVLVVHGAFTVMVARQICGLAGFWLMAKFTSQFEGYFVSFVFGEH